MQTISQFQPSQSATQHRGGWLISPLFDTLLIANLFWPIIALVMYVLPLANEQIGFIQVYLLSTPHRWVTLIPVFFDKKNFQQQPGRFVAIGSSLLLLGLTLTALGSNFPHPADPSNPLIYFMMLDYAWNAWHFASQHAGIARIYGRKIWPGDSTSRGNKEKSSIRILILWVFIRVAVRLRPESFPVTMLPWLSLCDLLMLTPMLRLLISEWARGTACSRMLYLGSVFGLYSVLLLGIHVASAALFSGLLVAQAVFHAVEYLAIIGWDMQRKQPQGIWRFLAPRAALIVILFSLIIGFTNYAVAARSIYAWTLITLLISLLHYGYDGMIWKSPRRSRQTAPGLA